MSNIIFKYKPMKRKVKTLSSSVAGFAYIFKMLDSHGYV